VSGLGKSWLACALGHDACRENMSVLYTPAPRFFADLAIAYGMSVAFATQLANCAQRTAGPGVLPT
jgi:DNA replication protein DnaC